MKRYWLFCIRTYYPSGGLGDLIGTFDTWKECIQKKEDKDGRFFSIFDSEEYNSYDLDGDNIKQMFTYKDDGFWSVTKESKK
jgi:hypothetical protein